MHTLQLGLFTVCNAEGILMLCRLLPCELPEALKETFKRFKRWCSSCKVTCSQRQWTVGSLHLTSMEGAEGYPWLKAKLLTLGLSWPGFQLPGSVWHVLVHVLCDVMK